MSGPSLPRFGTVDAKAAAWTQTQVLLHWIDETGKVYNEWVLAVRYTGCAVSA